VLAHYLNQSRPIREPVAITDIRDINQNAHLGTSKQEVFCFLESGDSGFARDGRKSHQKVFKRFSTLEVVEKRLYGHSRSEKHGRSANDIGVFGDHSHERIVSRAIEASAAGAKSDE
jgi:hypothetical protein